MAKKRGQNEGGIYQRANGTWEARVSLGYDALGKRIRKSVYGPTRADVRAKMERAQRQARTGVRVENRTSTREYLALWLENSARPKVRPTTFRGYARYVKLHLAPALGRTRLDRLTPQQVQAFLNAKLATGLRPCTVRQMHAILRKALNQALKWGLVERNVATLVDPPRIVRDEIAPLTPDEAKALLASLRDSRLEALYTVALAVGLRQGEALGLRWTDMDLEAGTVAVQGQLQRLDGEFVLLEPKTHRSRRTLDLPAVCVAALRRHKVRQAEERLLAGADWQDWGLVFTTRRGTPLHASNVVRSFHAELKKAGLRRQRFHDLRHACATLLLVQGISPRVVMELLGHSQIGITMNLYTHVMPSLKRDAADQMDALLTGNSRT